VPSLAARRGWLHECRYRRSIVAVDRMPLIRPAKPRPPDIGTVTSRFGGIASLLRLLTRRLAAPMSAVGRLLRRMAVGKAASLESPYVFPHTAGPNVGEPIRDIKNGFHKAMKLAAIEGFTWHDLRHTFASWLMIVAPH